MSQTNISTNSVGMIHIIFDRLDMNEVHFLSFILSISLCFLYVNKYVTIIIYVLQFLWAPYETPQIRPLINNVEVSIIVHAKVPLIYFAIVE